LFEGRQIYAPNILVALFIGRRNKVGIPEHLTCFMLCYNNTHMVALSEPSSLFS